MGNTNQKQYNSHSEQSSWIIFAIHICCYRILSICLLVMTLSVVLLWLHNDCNFKSKHEVALTKRHSQKRSIVYCSSIEMHKAQLTQKITFKPGSFMLVNVMNPRDQTEPKIWVGIILLSNEIPDCMDSY